MLKCRCCIVGDSGQRHIVEFLPARLPLGDRQRRRTDAEVCARTWSKPIPTARLGQLADLHEEVTPAPRPIETALLIGRALYGADLEFLRYGDGWIRLLTHIAVAESRCPCRLPAPSWKRCRRPGRRSRSRKLSLRPPALRGPRLRAILRCQARAV